MQNYKAPPSTFFKKLEEQVTKTTFILPVSKLFEIDVFLPTHSMQWLKLHPTKPLAEQNSVRTYLLSASMNTSFSFSLVQNRHFSQYTVKQTIKFTLICTGLGPAKPTAFKAVTVFLNTVVVCFRKFIKMLFETAISIFLFVES